jgi:hypothetical protein
MSCNYDGVCSCKNLSPCHNSDLSQLISPGKTQCNAQNNGSFNSFGSAFCTLPCEKAPACRSVNLSDLEATSNPSTIGAIAAGCVGGGVLLLAIVALVVRRRRKPLDQESANAGVATVTVATSPTTQSNILLGISRPPVLELDGNSTSVEPGHCALPVSRLDRVAL